MNTESVCSIRCVVGSAVQVQIGTKFYQSTTFDSTSTNKEVFFKPIPRANSPHHIHAFLPVRKDLASRIFDFEKGLLDGRLEKDLRSIVTVSSFLIEPVRTDEAEDWARYMLKGKSEIDFLD